MEGRPASGRFRATARSCQPAKMRARRCAGPDAGEMEITPSIASKVSRRPMGNGACMEKGLLDEERDQQLSVELRPGASRVVLRQMAKADERLEALEHQFHLPAQTLQQHHVRQVPQARRPRLPPRLVLGGQPLEFISQHQLKQLAEYRAICAPRLDLPMSRLVFAKHDHNAQSDPSLLGPEVNGTAMMTSHPVTTTTE